METIKVKILEDGKTAREVNPLGEKPKTINNFPLGLINTIKFNTKKVKEWQEAEQKLRTFEIVEIALKEPNGEIYISEISDDRYSLVPNSLHTAQILETGKIRII